jgi:protein-S-isoprenylcysteine O-methyltransferase Ste14
MRHAIKTLPDGRLRDTAGVIAAPPLLFGAALVVALVLHASHPMRITPLGNGAPRLAGVALLVVGLLLSSAVMRAFGRAGTHVSPYRKTTRFVSTGPYRYTRNPDYLGQTLMYAGIAVVANSWWPLFLLPLVLIVVGHGVIRREERYLEEKFGQEYRDYTARVPRWL